MVNVFIDIFRTVHILALPWLYLSPTMILYIYVRSSSLFISFLQFRNKVSSTQFLLRTSCPCCYRGASPNPTLAAHRSMRSYSWRNQSGYSPLPRSGAVPLPGPWKWWDLWQPHPQTHPGLPHVGDWCPPDLWQAGGLVSSQQPQDVFHCLPLNHDEWGESEEAQHLSNFPSIYPNVSRTIL